MERIDSVIDIDKVTFPKLVRCRPKKINVERVHRGGGLQLESKIDENISLSLEQAASDDTSPEEVPKLRIVVDIAFSAKWRDKASKNDVLSFEAIYEGIFHFTGDISPNEVEEFVQSKLYRDILISQCYPVTRTQMIATLQTMGINPKRDLGFDLHNGPFELTHP